MTEEVKQDAIDQGTKIEGEGAGQSLAPVEQEALNNGWMTKEQWVAAGHPEEEHRSAREWNERGSLFKRINDQNRKLEQITQAFNALQQHHKMVFDRAHQQAINDLKAQHKTAVEAGDLQKAEEIVDQIQVQKEQAVRAQTQPGQVPVVSADFEDFVTRNNSWYGKDDVMTAYADRLGFTYTAEQRNTGRIPAPGEVLKYVEEKVRDKFPGTFGVQRSKASPSASPVGPAASPSRPTAKASKSASELPAEAQAVMKTLVRQGVMTEKQYLDEYFGRG